MERKIIQVGSSVGLTLPLSLIRSQDLKLGDFVEIEIKKVRRAVKWRHKPMVEKLNICQQLGQEVTIFLHKRESNTDSITGSIDSVDFKSVKLVGKDAIEFKDIDVISVPVVEELDEETISLGEVTDDGFIDAKKD